MRGRLGWVLLSWGLSAACGGRYEPGGEETGAGGISVGQAGVASRGGMPSSGGAPSAGTTSAGAVTSTSGTGAGGGCSCDVPVCPPGQHIVPSLSGCCSECVFDETCDVQRKNYVSYRGSMVAKFFPFKCSQKSDCITYYDHNECQAPSCGILIDAASRVSLDATLASFARMHCDPRCPPVPVPPCDAPTTINCFRGYCE